MRHPIAEKRTKEQRNLLRFGFFLVIVFVRDHEGHLSVIVAHGGSWGNEGRKENQIFSSSPMQTAKGTNLKIWDPWKVKTLVSDLQEKRRRKKKEEEEVQKKVKSNG